jgi:WD40 repeat protein
MGDLDDKDDKHADDLARLPSLFKEWQGLVAVLGGAVAAVLAVLLPGQTPAAVQVIGYTVAVALVVVGALIFIRVRRRQHSRQLRERRRAKWEREATGAHRTAFRGLFPYQEGDELPGEHRQLEARRLVTQFSEPTFSFGVVCGDSGCGKTSLLRSAIQSRLKAAGEDRGFGVLYLSNPRELADDGAQHADAKDIAARLGRELERLRRLTDGAAQGKSLILIIDQFEEFFIEYSSPELRLEIGRFLNGLIKASAPVRILCALRRDYLADMKDLAPQSPDSAADRNFFEPISLQTLFTLKNFTVEQAARVVRECAERDRVEIEEEFAAMLASDLGEGGFVRPPELQIVCTALVGSLTTADYRLAGGTRGILSHYIEDAIGVSGDPAVGRRVLRALCDFPAHAKRNPQTVADIAGAIGAEGAQASASIRTALRQFKVARLVVAEKRGEDEPAYALVHEYLVDAVSKATSDVSTSDEEANQLLDYYVSEYRTDPKTRIPYRRLRFVRKYADPKRLADPTARHLLRASVTKLVTSAAALAALVLITTTLLVAINTTSRVWHLEVVGHHWDEKGGGHLSWVIQPKRGLLLTGIAEGYSSGNVKVWDVKSARLMGTLMRREAVYIPTDYILGYAKEESVSTVFHLPTAREWRTVIPAESIIVGYSSLDGLMRASASGTAIAAIKNNIVSANSKEHGRESPLKVFSITENRMVGELDICKETVYPDFFVTDDGAYVLAPCGKDGIALPTVYDVRTKEQRLLARPGYKSCGNVAFDARSSRVAGLEQSGDGRVNLSLWDLRTGQLLDLADLTLKADPTKKIKGTVKFTPDGQFIYVTTPLVAGLYLALFRTDGLRRVTTVPERDASVVSVADLTGDADNERVLVTWRDESGGTTLWDLTESEPKTVAEYQIASGDMNVTLIPAGFRVLDSKNDRVVLWDFKAGRKLRTLDIPSRYVSLGFTIGGNAVSVGVEGGAVSLFRADNGEKITDDIRNIGGARHAIYYDEKCRRVHVWTDEGRVLRYTEGWHLFGRENWFWPAEKCETQ